VLTGWTIVVVLFNIIDVKAGWPIIELELLDCPTHHEPVEVRCAEVAGRVHGGGSEWIEIGGIAKDKLTFLSETTRTKKLMTWWLCHGPVLFKRAS